VPKEFEVDDFQVRTPTDIIGQHIHLPKWDLTTNDGAANGWNYEDGALSPEMVVERITAINRFNGLVEVANACAADHMSEVNFYDEKLMQTFGCADFTITDAGMMTASAVLNAGSLPGQLGPIELSGMDPQPTIATGDTGGTQAGLTQLTPVANPDLLAALGDNPQKAAGMYKGARTVIQRLLVDPIVNVAGVDRGLGLTFSHDHYGPSTFQQIGLYSTILAEPAGSIWKHNETGELLGMRDDGGPTSWQAVIDTTSSPSFVGANAVKPHREFYFEMSDFQHAYEKDVWIGADEFGVPTHTTIVQPSPFNVVQAEVAAGEDLANSWKVTVNPPLKVPALPANNSVAVGGPNVVKAEGSCPGDGVMDPATDITATALRPCAEAINISHSSMWVTNYRNEPVGLRVFDPNKPGPDNVNGAQADGQAGDLALAFQSRRDRAIPQLNTSFGDMPYPTTGNCDGINCDRRPGDPITPIMRAYEHDEVKVKVQVGATEEQHQVTVHGMKWLSNGSGFGRSPNSGWRNFQSHGISEQFSLQVPINPDPQQRGNTVDYLYANDATRDGIWSGTWGILRSYGSSRNDLVELPGNSMADLNLTNDNEFNGVCPTSADVVTYDVVAVLANEALPNNLGVDIPANTNPTGNVGGPLLTKEQGGGTLVYNRRTTKVRDDVPNEGNVTFPGGFGPLNDPTGMLYTRLEDLEPRFISIDTGEVDEYGEPILIESPDAVGNYLTGDVDENGNPIYAIGPDNIDDRCQEVIGVTDPSDPSFDPTDPPFDLNLTLPGCPVKVAANAPVEPVVLRGNAGQCLEVTLHNKLIDQALVDYEPVFTCENDTTGVCVAGTLEPLFDAQEAQDALDQGLLLVDAGGNQVVGDIVFDQVPDLEGWQGMMWVVNRDLNPANPKPLAARGNEMFFFNNNLIRPSASVGLHAQLVEYDASRDDGLVVGDNAEDSLAFPGGKTTYRWYAGDISIQKLTGGKKRDQGLERVATPVEFGGTNLLSADRVKQPQKGLFGALVIEPEGAIYDETTLVPDGQMAVMVNQDGNVMVDGEGNPVLDPAGTRLTRAQATVFADQDPETDGVQAGDVGEGGAYREALAIGHKITNLRWADGTAIKNVNQEEMGREGAEDSGHAGFNYGMEPPWFRFQLPPNVPWGNAGHENTYGAIPNQHAFYANQLVTDGKHPNYIPEIIVNGVQVSEKGDPATPVFRAKAGEPARMHVLNGASADRDGTWMLHGHLWQRDPFVCTGADQDASVPLAGRCDPDAVASQALGLNPQGKWMATEEGMGHAYGHWPILLHSAGGSNAIPGDYLYRDYAPNGNRNGQFGILRVEQGTLGEPPAGDQPPADKPPKGGGRNK
jgi:hypothetical protein